MLSLIIPAYSAGPDIERTISSVNGICDDVVVISTALYPEDLEAFKQLTPKVVELPWNAAIHNGFGWLYNQGTPLTKNDWCLLFGVAETWAESFMDVPRMFSSSSREKVYRCTHHADPCTWKRIWNKQSSASWSGLIHEEITGGHDGGICFRFQDTPKTPGQDQYRNEAFRYIKACLYHSLYLRLHDNPGLLGGTNRAWLNFVAGAISGINSYVNQHQDLIGAMMSGDRQRFIDLVKERVDKGFGADGVKWAPVGEKATTPETINSNELG